METMLCFSGKQLLHGTTTPVHGFPEKVLKSSRHPSSSFLQEQGAIWTSHAGSWVNVPLTNPAFVLEWALGPHPLGVGAEAAAEKEDDETGEMPIMS